MSGSAVTRSCVGLASSVMVMRTVLGKTAITCEKVRPQYSFLRDPLYSTSPIARETDSSPHTRDVVTNPTISTNLDGMDCCINATCGDQTIHPTTITLVSHHFVYEFRVKTVERSHIQIP